MQDKTFREYRPEAEAWITLANGDYYPDILPFAAHLYGPVLAQFGQLLRESHSSTNLFICISETPNQWMRTQLCRVFKKYVSPADTSRDVEAEDSRGRDLCQFRR